MAVTWAARLAPNRVEFFGTRREYIPVGSLHGWPPRGWPPRLSTASDGPFTFYLLSRLGTSIQGK